METLNTYDFIEGTEFEALMPAVMKSAPTIGATEEKKNVRLFDNFHRGSDYLEVVDVQGFYESSDSGDGDEPQGTGDEPQGTGDEPQGTGDEPQGTGDEPQGTGE